jgi:hypothetical protein
LTEIRDRPSLPGFLGIYPPRHDRHAWMKFCLPSTGGASIRIAAPGLPAV